MREMLESKILVALERIANSLEILAPEPRSAETNDTATAFIWNPEGGFLSPVERVNRLDIKLLKGIDRSMSTLFDNTKRFALGFPANNALLWGARGTGKSSLVKAVHGTLLVEYPCLSLVEIHREDISTLTRLLPILKKDTKRRFILFCDDLSFEAADESYKSLKTLLEGGIEGRPQNVIFYATSNRRHLMSREISEQTGDDAINSRETAEERISLSDRFGLWLGFHNCDQETFLKIIDAYAEHFELLENRKELHSKAIEWSVTRGARSGRVAWQFIQDIAGEQGKSLDI